MKRFLIAAVLAAATVTTPALAADVGVSISIGDPGFYGRLDIGDYPPPQVIYRQPRVIQRVPMDRPPVYLRVPPGHAKNWSKNCRKYNACGERVYFVKDSWYNREYAPRYREQHRDRRDERRDDNRGKQKYDRQGNDRGHGRN
ncbi:MAG: hypothetical protein WC392_13000 [Sulfuricella sp.]|jgi:hypothetical protein